MDPVEVPLFTAEDGAVACGLPGYYCSIAHSGGRAVAATAKRSIGVDIERIQPRSPGLMDYLLRPDEYDVFSRLPLDKSHALILCWTLKEAALKAVRIGLRHSAKACRLEINYLAQSAKAFIEGSTTALRVAFIQQDGFYISVAFADRVS